MAKREKILLLLMVVAVAYGAFELFYVAGRPEPQTPSPAGLQSAQDMTQRISAEIEEAELSRKQQYVMEIASKQFPGDLFYVLPEAEDVPVENDGDGEMPVTLDYTGYLEVGGRRMAIINGVEYKAGESLEKGGLVVKQITPGHVLIESTENGRRFSVSYGE